MTGSVLQIWYLLWPVNLGFHFKTSSQAVVGKYEIFVIPFFMWFRDMHECYACVGGPLCGIIYYKKHFEVSGHSKTNGQPKLNFR